MSILDSMFGEKCKRCHDKRIGSNKDYCDDCLLKIKAEGEKKYDCLSCGTKMEKKIGDGIIIDKCPKCNAVWLDGGELEKIKEKVADEHGSDGMESGMVIGMMLDPF
jgi:hypothetical protein